MENSIDWKFLQSEKRTPRTAPWLSAHQKHVSLIILSSFSCNTQKEDKTDCVGGIVELMSDDDDDDDNSRKPPQKEAPEAHSSCEEDNDEQSTTVPVRSFDDSTGVIDPGLDQSPLFNSMTRTYSSHDFRPHPSLPTQYFYPDPNPRLPSDPPHYYDPFEIPYALDFATQTNELPSEPHDLLPPPHSLDDSHSHPGIQGIQSSSTTENEVDESSAPNPPPPPRNEHAARMPPPEPSDPTHAIDAAMHGWFYTGYQNAYPTSPILDPMRYPMSSPIATAASNEESLEDDRKPAASPIDAKQPEAKSPSKRSSSKRPPKKVTKPKKHKAKSPRNRNSTGSSSSSSAASVRTYSQMRATEEEIESLTTERAKTALESWYGQLRNLYRFRDLEGHTQVPQKYPKNKGLGVWVNKQRMERKAYNEAKPSSLTERKIEKLEEADFTWAQPKGVVAWENQYAELKKYAKVHGHPNVPTKFKDNRALGRWVSTQRNMWKKFQKGEKYNSLAAEEVERRVRLLDALGFVWNMSTQSSSSDGSNREQEADQEDESDEHEGNG